MNLPEFVHHAPKTLQEAFALLSTYQRDARVLAGGTDLLVKMKHRRQVPPHVVNIKRIPGLDYVRYEEGQGLRIGALTTIETIKGSPEVRRKYPMLHEAISYMATIEIRNRATLAGNVCNASPAAENVPALLLLGAKARIASKNGERVVPLEEFFMGPGRTVLQPDEIVTEIQIPEPAPRSSGAYDKFSLRRMDIAVVGAAAQVTMNGGACDDIKIVLSSVGPTALRARKAEEVLRGQAPNEELIQRAGLAAMEDSRPITDLFGTADYKRNIVGIITPRVIKQALERAGQGGS